jgi:23S rRNA (adenine2503-C2)-methyltransferase
MGMGEPFLNYDNVIKTAYILNDKNKFNIGARKISISTVGAEGIRKLASEPLQLNLAVSLHAPNDDIRSRLIPLNKVYNISGILSEVKKFIQKTNRKVMIEYLLLDKINDKEEHAQELADLLKQKIGKLFFVNLINYNFTDNKYKPSSAKQLSKFKKVLEQNNINVVQRYEFGSDIKAACGQLAQNNYE